MTKQTLGMVGWNLKKMSDEIRKMADENVKNA
jgi:hypothetical protein